MSPTLASSSWWERVVEGKPMERVREWYAWYCLGMVLLAGVLDQADKWALASLQAAGLQCSSCGVPSDPFYPSCIEQCLPLDDVAMGFLTGPALSIGALLAGLPLGWAADRYSRVRLLWLGLLLWSGATLASAFVVSFWQLAVARIVLGVGQAAVNPTGFSLLADWFVPRRRGLVLSIFSSMIFVGQICGLMTGAVSQHWSWRVAFAVLGAPGLVLAVPFILTVWEPKRGLHDVLGHATPQPEAATLHLGAGDGAIGIGTLITSPPVDAVAAAGPLDHDLKPRRRTSYSSGHYQHDDTTAPIEYYTEHDLDVASSTTATTTTTADAQGSSGIPGPVPLLVRTRYIVTHLPFVMYVGVHSLADSMRRGGDCLIAIARCRLAVSAAARFMGGYAIGATIQVFFRRVYGVQPATISYAMSFIVTVGGLPACYIGGWLADTWNLVRGGRRRQCNTNPAHIDGRIRAARPCRQGVGMRHVVVACRSDHGRVLAGTVLGDVFRLPVGLVLDCRAVVRTRHGRRARSHSSVHAFARDCHLSHRTRPPAPRHPSCHPFSRIVCSIAFYQQAGGVGALSPLIVRSLARSITQSRRLWW